MRFVALLLVLGHIGCGDYVVRLPLKSYEEFGAARGIYQGEDPPANTVYDSFNIDTVDGRWKTRPGIKMVLSGACTAPDLWNGTVPIGVGEYAVDDRYETSGYPAIVVIGLVSASKEKNIRVVKSRGDVATISWPSGVDVGGSVNDKFRFAPHLIRRLKNNGESEYTPALIATNGKDQPLVYHQFDDQDNVDVLDAIDPGYSDATTLAEVPRGRFIAVFREKLFMANTPDAANRVWSSTPELGGAFTANSWLSSYNFDVGHGEKITGLLPYRDTMLIFTDQRVYSISGSGVDCDWDLRVVDDERGALEDCYTICNGQVYFANKDGMFILGKGNISHPALVSTWPKLLWDDIYGGPLMYSDG
ncbi:MAG: hypothetical protein JRF33_25290, partial [Deltaproteobacteria bacterium]|nr:hypothetical protein [Deltaproteobacteria bacterium]